MNPEIEKLIVCLIHEEECLCLTYTDVQVLFLTDEMCLPYMSRLFELIEGLERERLSEVRRFLVSRGSKVGVTTDVKPVKFVYYKPIEILKAVLRQENTVKDIAVQLSKMALDKSDTELMAFIESRVLLRLCKVIYKSEQQIRSIDRRCNDDLTPMLVEDVFVDWQAKRLERQLTFEFDR